MGDVVDFAQIDASTAALAGEERASAEK